MSKGNRCSEDDLIAAYHEHCLRELLRDFISGVLQEMSHGELEFQRITSLDLLSELSTLAYQVDLTQSVLSIVVNKLGDKVKKV